MTRAVKRSKRAYDASRRRAAADRTREAIVVAAKARFEERGWSGTTIAAIAEDARVSPKTVEAVFGTKAALLGEVVDYAIRGDIADTPMLERRVAHEVEQAPDAATLLDRHAAYAVAITARSARVAWVVESAAPSDANVARLWGRMLKNRRFGAGWAATSLLGKSGVRDGLTREEAEVVFLVAIDWGTYRTLATDGGLDAEGVRDWLAQYYRRMLLP
jgi:AcrR family transcriptional regulator